MSTTIRVDIGEDRALADALRRAEAAEAYATQTLRLLALADHLGGLATPEQVARAILDQARNAASCTAGVVYAVDPQGVVKALDAIGYDERSAVWEPFVVGADLPAAKVIVGGQPLFFGDRDALLAAYPAMEGARLESAAWAVLPLEFTGTRLGALVLAFPRSMQFAEQDRAFLGGLAQVCAQALQRARTRRELGAMRAELAQSEKLSALGSLVSGVAHEIRTPLTYLGNNLYLIESAVRRILKDRAPEEAAAVAQELKPRFSQAQESIDRIDRIVEDLRRYTRTTSETTWISLDVAVRDAVELYRATHRGEVVLKDDLQPTRRLLLDRVQLQQVALNLLQNAGEAAARDGAVEIRTFDSPDGGVVLEVRDHGPGIPPEVLDRIWDPFFTTKKEGSGLGLSIVRRIVDLHHGTITCETAPGKGTLFRVKLAPAGGPGG